jgi:hypothetical protein
MVGQTDRGDGETGSDTVAAAVAVLCVSVPLGHLWSAVSTNRRSVPDLLVGSAVVYDGH